MPPPPSKREIHTAFSAAHDKNRPRTQWDMSRYNVFRDKASNQVPIQGSKENKFLHLGSQADSREFLFLLNYQDKRIPMVLVAMVNHFFIHLKVLSSTSIPGKQTYPL